MHPKSEAFHLKSHNTDFKSKVGKIFFDCQDNQKYIRFKQQLSIETSNMTVWQKHEKTLQPSSGRCNMLRSNLSLKDWIKHNSHS